MYSHNDIMAHNNNYDASVRHVLDTILKHKDRLDFYPSFTNVALGVSDLPAINL